MASWLATLASSQTHSSHKLSNWSFSFLARIVWIKASHNLVRALRVVMMSSSSSKLSPIASNCSLSNPREIALDCFSFLHLRILELGSRVHLMVDVLFFIHYG
jgi:hypothetical protein